MKQKISKKPWNGMLKKEQVFAPPGVYHYKITITDKKNKPLFIWECKFAKGNC